MSLEQELHNASEKPLVEYHKPAPRKRYALRVASTSVRNLLADSLPLSHFRRSRSYASKYGLDPDPEASVNAFCAELFSGIFAAMMYQGFEHPLAHIAAYAITSAAIGIGHRLVQEYEVETIHSRANEQFEFACTTNTRRLSK